jgi:hypothetical protein
MLVRAAYNLVQYVYFVDGWTSFFSICNENIPSQINFKKQVTEHTEWKSINI